MQVSSTTPSYQQTATSATKATPKEDPSIHPRGSKEHAQEQIHNMLNRDFPKDVATALEKETEGMQPVEVAIMTSRMQMSIGHYASGNGVKAHFEVQTDSNGNVTYPDLLSKEQMKQIDFGAYLQEALDHFKAKAPKSSTEVKQSYDALISDYTSLQNTYNKQKSEPIYA